MGVETAPAESMVAPSAKTSPLRWVTAGSPTNYNMLLFRTLNREMGASNANQDTLAPLFRDKLMPLRMWWLNKMPGALRMFKQGLEHKKHGVPGVCNFVDARTSWFDCVVKEAVEQHGISQVVVVAAGFDTRAYRIGAKHSGVKFFEVDLPHASQKKQELVDALLQPPASFPRPTYLAADLSKTPLDSALLTHTNTNSSNTTNGTSSSSSKFDPTQPTLFTVEGLVYYLPHSAVQALFGAMLRVAAPGSRVAFDFLHQEVLDGRAPAPPAYKVTATSVANKGEPFRSGLSDSKQAVQAFMDTVTGAAPQAPAKTPDAAVFASAIPVPPITPAPTPAYEIAPAGTAAAADAIAAAAAAAGARLAVAAAGSNGARPAAAAMAAAGIGSNAAAAAAGSDSNGSNGARLAWRVVDYMGPKEAVSRFLPHLVWDDEVPPILSFYSYASAEVVAA